ncbi:MAG: lipid-A-disaccharide synthase [Allorhizobium sp.]
MTGARLKIAVIAGEVSGDLLGGDLVAALKQQYQGEIELFGIGGESLQAEGLASLIDFSELSVMGFTQVLARLPRFIQLIGQTARAIVAAKPDLLLVIDSPDFTHRVAKKVRKSLPDLPVVNYVCPSVWAWKEYRARAMLSYVDTVLAVLPFEPAVMERLGGPKTHFIGHRLTADPKLIEVRATQRRKAVPVAGRPRTILLLPGSRASEIRAMLPLFGDAASQLVARNGPMRFLLPTVPHQERLVREIVAGFALKPEILVGTAEKWRAFTEADAAMAASGTVILELALAGIPVVSAYKADWLTTQMASRIKAWSAALPNLIADFPVVPEYLNDSLRAGSLVRWIERISVDTIQRRAMLDGFGFVWEQLSSDSSPGQKGARIVLDLLRAKKAGRG